MIAALYPVATAALIAGGAALGWRVVVPGLAVALTLLFGADA